MYIISRQGDMLFVPKHWWHFVTTESDLAVTSNVWLPVDSDVNDRVSESIVRYM